MSWIARLDRAIHLFLFRSVFSIKRKSGIRLIGLSMHEESEMAATMLKAVESSPLKSEKPATESKRTIKQVVIEAITANNVITNDALIAAVKAQALARMIHEGSSRGGADGHGYKAREGRIPQAYLTVRRGIRPSATQ